MKLKISQIKNELDQMLNSGICDEQLSKQIQTFEYNQDIDAMNIKFNIIKDTYKALKMEWDKQDAKQQVEEIKSFLLSEESNLVIAEIKNYDNKNVFNALTDLINEKQDKVFAVLNIVEDKVQYMLATNQKNKINLNDTIRKINEFTQGKGGGKPNFVQGGCLAAVDLSKIIGIIKENINA